MVRCGVLGLVELDFSFLFPHCNFEKIKTFVTITLCCAFFPSSSPDDWEYTRIVYVCTSSNRKFYCRKRPTYITKRVIHSADLFRHI